MLGALRVADPELRTATAVYAGAMIERDALPPFRVALLPPGDRGEWCSASAVYGRARCRRIMPAIAEQVEVAGRPRRHGASLGALAMLQAQRTWPDTFAPTPRSSPRTAGWPTSTSRPTATTTSAPAARPTSTSWCSSGCSPPTLTACSSTPVRATYPAHEQERFAAHLRGLAGPWVREPGVEPAWA